MWAGLTDLHIKTPMGITAENLAEKYHITREDCDNYAYQTQQRWKAGKAGFVLRYFYGLSFSQIVTLKYNPLGRKAGIFAVKTLALPHIRSSFLIVVTFSICSS